MTKNAQRLSQLISTFGPGAMIDLPTRSVVVGGLEQWDMKGNAFTTLPEPRLTMRLEQILKEQGRLDPAARLTLRTPPTSVDTRDGIPRGVAAPIFPTWFICEQVETNTSGAKATRRRRLVRWQDLDSKGRRRFQYDDGRKSDVTPIRFVCACDKGHLQDIDWRWVVHGSGPCHEPMWVEEKGTSADPADTSIVCGCGRRLSLQDTFQPGRLGKCRGERPWLLDRDPEGCGDNLKLLTRTATNTYFPQVHTVISLPTEEDELSQLVDELSGDLAGVQTVQDVAQAKKFNPKVSASLGPYSDGDIFDRLQRIREGAKTDATRSPKLSEFDTFASGRSEIGANHPTAKLYAQTLPREAWADPDAGIDLSGIKNLVAVHRLREVSCLYGFTRFEAAPTGSDGDIEDIQLSVRGAPISRDADWLPAIEQFGEGIFIHFDAAAIGRMASKGGHGLTQSKAAGWLRALAKAFCREGAGLPRNALRPSSQYLARVDGRDRPGLRLSGQFAEGTCLRAVQHARRRRYRPLRDPDLYRERRCAGHTRRSRRDGSEICVHPQKRLDRLRICSNDPVCADHEPDDRSGDRATHGAACHGCLLIAETSCEMRNLFLDRSLLVPTMADDLSCFFK